MPAVDPLSANSRALGPLDTGPSNPLAFGATLLPWDINREAAGTGGAALPSKAMPRRKHEEGMAFPEVMYKHNRSASSASTRSLVPTGLASPGIHETPTLLDHPIGSDQWMSQKVAQHVDNARTKVDLGNLGLTSLSTCIAQLDDLVTLPSSSSPMTNSPARSRMSPALRPALSPHNPSPALSPGSNHLSANSSSFTRHVSAPESAFAFRRAAADISGPATARVSSGLARGFAGPTLMGSPVLVEEGNAALSAAQPVTGQNLLTRRSALGEGSASPVGTTRSPGGLETRRQFGRSKTFALNQSPVAASAPTAKDISVNLAQNQLCRLPSALFEVTNLTSLSLRNNKLTALPAAIGHLTHLKVLNIGINQITVLPSTILNLELTEFYPHPNPYRPPPPAVAPADPSATQPSGKRRLGPLTSHGIPRLGSICLRVLLSSRPGGSSLPPLLSIYDWIAENGRGRHPLLDATALHRYCPQIPLADCERILQVVRSTISSAKKGPTATRFDPIVPQDTLAAPPADDAATNPYYYPCPSPRHLEYTTGPVPAGQPVTRQIFLHPAEERIEWTSVLDNTNLPVQWLGCSPGCLDFLEDDSDDSQWGLSDDE